MKKLIISLVILLAVPMSNIFAESPRKPPPTLQELLPQRAPNKVCPSIMEGAWVDAYLHAPQVGYLTLGYYYGKRLIEVAIINASLDQPLLVIDFDERDTPLIGKLGKLDYETEFSKECENLGTETLEVKK